ncbi:hypothetical protein MPL3365_10091 [Mesorhizobium plurifarium]|uniref:Uncharacterized protein n=1 Tax=Mesorhizobium plurifarium TaxID=69974 RepID=A0A090FZM0_MESPL|nr:hypothetical protein MPL3365_10091 [Mesorhizobium plurifarium]
MWVAETLVLRHLRAEQGAQRRSADPRIHSVALRRHYGAELCSAAPDVRDNGMDARVSARSFAPAPP